MSPKSQEKQQQQQQQQLLNKHSKPFYISAHGLCHNKYLKMKRCRWLQAFNKMQQRNKPDMNNPPRKQVITMQAVETIDLLSDDDNDDKDKDTPVTSIDTLRNDILRHQQQMAQLFNSNGLSTLYVTNNIANYINIPAMTLAHPPQLLPMQLPLPPPPPPLPPPMQVPTPEPKQPAPHLQSPLPPAAQIQIPIPVAPIANANANRDRVKTSGKRKASKPRKRPQMPIRTLECNESIVLSDTEDNNGNNRTLNDIEMNVLSLSEQNIPRDQQQYHNYQQPQQEQQQIAQSCNSIQVDEVTVSLIPRNYTNLSTTTSQQSIPNTMNNEHITEPFPMVPDETTVQTVIANRTYELSLTKLREGLASCGIPEFADTSVKVNASKKKSTALPPELIVTPQQQPISLKLSSDLSISLISDDDDDDDDDDHDNGGAHTNKLNRLTENSGVLVSPTLLQKLPLNVSIAPVPKNWPCNKLPKRKLG